MREELASQLFNLTQLNNEKLMVSGIIDLIDKIGADTLNEALMYFNREVVLNLLPNVLSEGHSGSCTGHPWSCNRCYFEEHAEQTTVTWSKQEGHTAIYEA